jgi:diguanylate cyclase (GGDEF)-like protein/PAS domain S-box-containing protein
MQQDMPVAEITPATTEDLETLRAEIAILEARLRATETELAAILAHTDDLAYVADANGQLSFANRAWREALGYDMAMPETLTAEDLFVGENREIYRAAHQQLLDGAPIAPIEVRLSGIDGRQIEVQGILAGRAMADGIAVRALFRSMIARQQQDAHLAFATTHDRLTGLANRAHIVQLIPQALARATRAGTAIGILALDLDNFRSINTRFGHAWADQALVTVADHLRRCVRAGDIAARLAGDEFAIVVERVDHPGDLRRVAERIMTAVAIPQILGREWALLSGTIGGAISTAQTADAEQLLLAAESAMLQAKQAGGGRFALAEEEVPAIQG